MHATYGNRPCLFISLFFTIAWLLTITGTNRQIITFTYEHQYGRTGEEKSDVRGIRDFAFQWDSDIKDLCTQNKQAKSGIPREKLSLVLEKMCVHECL